MHHLVHYPSYIRMFGPLNQYWCMSYEAKHSYFKQLQRRIRNYIQVPVTLAMRHQQWQCNELRSAGKQFMNLEITTPKANAITLWGINGGEQVAQDFGVNDLSINVDQLNWVGIGSIKFKANESIVLCYLKGSQKCQFGLVTNIVTCQGQIRLICKLYRTRFFNQHLQSFKITEREIECFSAVNPLDLAIFTMNFIFLYEF